MLYSIETVDRIAVVLARGKIIDVKEVGGRELYSFDGMYYFHKDSTKYKMIPKTPEDTGEPMKFNRFPTLVLKSMESTEPADVYVDISENARHDLYLSLCNIIGRFEGIGAKWANYDSRLFVQSEYYSSGYGMLRFLEVMNHEPSKIPKMFKCTVVDQCETLGSTVVRIDHISDVDDIERFEHLTALNKYLETYVSCGNLDIPENDLVYMNNMGRRSFQWELWAMCNNLCKYCYLGTANRSTNKERQLKSLSDCYRAVCNLDFNIYNNISIIGGEFFQGQLDDPEVHDEFMKLMRKCCELYSSKKIGSIWVTCTMTLGDQKHLYEMLDMFEEYECYPKPQYGASGLWLCTSWDAEGRFHTEDHRKNWEYHMKNIHEKYPWVKFNTTIILMQKLLEMYIDGEWSPKQFMDEFHTCLFYKQIGLGELPPEIYDGVEVSDDWQTRYRIGKQYVNKTFGFDFAPRRQTMLKFLRKYAVEDPDTYDRLYNIVFRADELHRNYNDWDRDCTTVRNKHSNTETDVEMESHLNTCGHILNYAPYIDSDKCCICDKQMIWDSIHGGM